MTVDTTGPATSGLPVTPAVPGPAERLFGPQHRWTAIGMSALIFLAAFEAMAVTAVMPAVAAELEGQALYALAFAGPLAVSVVGMILAGNAADRGGPRLALLASVVLFVAGLVLAGSATDMTQLVVGRLVHGVGGGGLTVALYVLVARLLPAALQPAIFAAFAAAWVVPSLIGPFVAGVVADGVGWPWVFLGVTVLVVPALLMILPSLRRMPVEAPAVRPPWNLARIGWAALAGAGVLVLNLSTGAEGWAEWVVPAAAVVVILLAARPLVPRGTLRAIRGLPAAVATRGLIGGAFFGTQVYLPLLLTGEAYGLSTSMAGLVLTVGGVAWAAASQVQGRNPVRLSNERALRIGLMLLGTAVAGSIAATLLQLHPVAFMVVWGVAGAGMGLMYPRTTVIGLQSTAADQHGEISSALAVSDALGAAVAIALTALVFAALAPAGPVVAVAGAVVVALGVWALALAAGLRAHVEPVRG